MAGQVQLWAGAGFQLARAATTFKSSAPISAAGDTTLWTPPSGWRFRLLAYCLEITAEASKATSPGDLAMTLLDGGADIGLIHSAYMPSTSVTTNPGLCYSTGWVRLGELGIMSAAVNNVLAINLSFALATGKLRARVAGTVEV
jgi:hypothetical protein